MTLEDYALDVGLTTQEVKELCDKYPTNSAPKVPVLPEVVTIADVLDSMKGLNSVPVGIEKERLLIIFFWPYEKFKLLILNLIV